MFYRLFKFLSVEVAGHDGGHGLVLIFPALSEGVCALLQCVSDCIGLCVKFTFTNRIGDLLKLVGCPAVAGVSRAGLGLPNGLVQTFLGLQSEVLRQLVTIVYRRLVDLLSS